MDQRLTVEKPLPEELKRQAPEQDRALRVSREIKYIDGADKKWFTKDDEVYHYFLLSYDDPGRLAKRSCFVTGDDKQLMTGDDVLQDYLVYEYGPDGKTAREILYDGKGGLKYTAVYAYDDAGQKSGLKRYDINGKETGSMNFFSGMGGSIARDVEYKNDQIEKYHRFTYDGRQRLVRAVEYLGSAGGMGADGAWLTDDDVVTSAKQFFYNKDGTKDKEKKYIKPGPDKKWFTKDDVIQYYTVFYYQK